MRRDASHASIGRILLEHLPDDLLGHGLALYVVASIHRAEYSAFRNAARGSPHIDRHLHPGRHRHGADAAVLANEVYDTPAAIALLDVCERQRRGLKIVGARSPGGPLG